MVLSDRRVNEVRGQEIGKKRGAKYIASAIEQIFEGIIEIGLTMDEDSINKSSEIGDICDH